MQLKLLAESLDVRGLEAKTCNLDERQFITSASHLLLIRGNM